MINTPKLQSQQIQMKQIHEKRKKEFCASLALTLCLSTYGHLSLHSCTPTTGGGSSHISWVPLEVSSC